VVLSFKPFKVKHYKKAKYFHVINVARNIEKRIAIKIIIGFKSILAVLTKYKNKKLIVYINSFIKILINVKKILKRRNNNNQLFQNAIL